MNMEKDKNKGKVIVIKATLQLHGKNSTLGIAIPNEILAEFGTSKKTFVKAKIKNHTFRASIASVGGKFFLGISADVIASADIDTGDEIDVELQLDAEVKDIIVPEDLKIALEQNDAALRNFNQLSHNNKRRLLIPIDEAKTEETRQRRIDKIINVLQVGDASK